MREQRKLAAVLAADVVGFSRLMGRDVPTAGKKERLPDTGSGSNARFSGYPMGFMSKKLPSAL